MEKNMLLVIDAQYDFINGSLAVKGSEEKMLKLAEYINKHKNEYDVICFTFDSHPLSHCSFDKNGGEWPMHCVEHSQGAALFQPLLDSVIEYENTLLMCRKGVSPSKEEYSIFENETSSKTIQMAMSINDIVNVYVCGIANEYCVLNTVKDMNEKLNIGNRVNILFDFVAAINDENVLLNYANENNIKVTRNE